jgi:hypothetical protein
MHRKVLLVPTICPLFQLPRHRRLKSASLWHFGDNELCSWEKDEGKLRLTRGSLRRARRQAQLLSLSPPRFLLSLTLSGPKKRRHVFHQSLKKRSFAHQQSNRARLVSQCFIRQAQWMIHQKETNFLTMTKHPSYFNHHRPA